MRYLWPKNRVFPASPRAFPGKSKNGVGNTNSSTLGVIGVGSTEGAPGRGDRQRPPDAVPGCPRAPTAASRQSVDSTEMACRKRRVVVRGWQQPGGGERRSAMDGKPHDAGPENRQPLPSLRRAAIDGWARNSCDGRVFHVARQGKAYHALSRRFATTSGFVNPLSVSRRHLYALYFLIRWAFYDILDSPGHVSKYLRFPNSTSGPIPETENGMPTSPFH